MSFKRNDIVSKQRLRDALEEETSMGFQHNDIVTTYAMDKAIAEGGGGGGDTEYVEVTFQLEEGLTGATVYGFFIFDYGQEGEYSEPYFSIESGTTTVYVPLYKGNGCVYAKSYAGNNCWFEGSNISEYGEITGSDTVTIHEVSG